MAVTWADVATIAPALAAVAPGMQAAILAQAALQVSPDAWGPGADLGVTYLAAHLATVAGFGGTGPAGPVTGETIGPISVQYAQPVAGKGDPALLATSYGREYVRLRRSFVVAI